MNVNINQLCPENWETMKIGLHSRFCENCEKNVIDFTNKDRREILEYLLTNYDKRICGRLYPSQLDFSHKDFLVTISALSRQSKNSNLPFYLLTLGTLILASCNNSEQSNEQKTKPVDTIVSNPIKPDTTSKSVQIEKSDTTKNDIKEKVVELTDIPILGEIAVGPDTTFGHTEPYPYVENMPEFVGGIDSLSSFIKQNLKYPEWEKSNKIEGTVYVRFVVDKNGKVKDSEILRTVEKAKNFDNEVLRVVNEMPDWKPGEHEGENVDVQFNLPIKFKL